MKIFTIVFILMFLCYYKASAAKNPLVVYCSSCPYIENVADLPDSPEFYSEEYKAQMDVGYLYEQFWIL